MGFGKETATMASVSVEKGRRSAEASVELPIAFSATSGSD
jgi:hypothetical protein